MKKKLLLIISAVTLTVTSGISQAPPNGSCGYYINKTTDQFLFSNQILDISGQSFTVEAWIKRSRTGVAEFVIRHGAAGNNNQALNFGYRDNDHFAFSFWADDLDDANAETSLTWIHWAATYDAATNTQMLYKNGVQVATRTANADYSGTGQLILGAGSSFIAQFQGNLDEVRVWNVARTGTEISNNYQVSFNSPQTNLIANYTFNEGTGSSVAFDKSGSGDYIYSESINNNFWRKDASVSGNKINENKVIAVNQSNYTYNTVTYTADTAFVENTLTASNGCDSLVIFVLDFQRRPPGNDCQNVLAFDGANDYVRTANNYLLNNDFTFETWVKRERFGVNEYIVSYGKQNGGTIDSYELLFNSNNEVQVLVNDFYTSSYPIGNELGWIHLAVAVHEGFNVANPTIYKLYINGVQVTSVNYAGINQLRSEYFDLGTGHNGTAPSLINPFVGQMDNVRIWNVERTAQEIMDNMNVVMNTPQSNLVISYVFEDGKGSGTVADVANPATNGSLMNMDVQTAWRTLNNTTDGNSFYEINSQAAYLSAYNWEGHTIPSIQNDTTLISGSTKTSGCDSIIYNHVQIIFDDAPNNACGSYVFLDGTNNSIQSDANIDLQNTSFTVEAWIKRDRANTSEFFISNGTTSASNGLHLGFRADNKFTFGFWADDFDTPETYPSLEWTHWAAVYDATTNLQQVYRNGVLIGSRTATADFQGTGKLIIGGLPDLSNKFMGNMDEVRVWSVARTGAEIQNNFLTTLTGSEPNLKLYYYMDEGTGTTSLFDKSAFLNHATTNNNLDVVNSWVPNDPVNGGNITNATAVSLPEGSTYNFNEQTYTSDTTVTATFTSANGCDSTVVLTISFQKTPPNGTCETVLAFDGTNDYVEAPYSSGNNTAQFSVSVWAKVEGGQGTFRAVASNRDIVGGNTKGWVLYANPSNKWNFFLGTGGGSFLEITGPDIVLGQWTHLAATYDGVNYKMYVDGTLETTSASAYAANTARTLRIGAGVNEGTPLFYFNGLIDEVSLWDKALIQSEITGLASASSLTGSESNLTAYYNFNQAGSLTLTDIKNGINGTLINMDVNTDWVLPDGNPGGTSSTGSVTVSACDSYVSPSGNYTWTTSGIHLDTIPNAAGCDSVITVNLTINHSTTGTDVQTACDTYTWPLNSTIYTSSTNTPTVTLTTAAGCDSLVTLDLTINNSNAGTDVISACDSYTWIDGNTYTSSNNTATHTLTNAAGCDSVVTLNLTINTAVDTSVTNTSPTLTANAGGAVYQWLDCDNGMAPLSGETGQTFTAATSGNYAVEITGNGCSVDTSGCHNITVTSILKNSFGSSLILYPNPTDGHIIIDLGTIYNTVQAEVSDEPGQIILKEDHYSSDKIQLQITGKPGIYFIRLNTENGEHAVIRVIKK